MVPLSLDRITKFVNIFAALAAVIGGAFALWSFKQESEKRLDDKKKATLEFVQMFNSDEFMSVRTTALSYLDRGIACDIGVGNDANRLNIFTYVDFFDSVLICVREQICDERTSFEFFERYANYHWPGFETHILLNRKLETDFKVGVKYGDGLQTFARKPTNVFACKNDVKP